MPLERAAFASVRGILLDIEGTTSSISFVHDIMFPFVLEHLDDYLAKHATEEATKAVSEQIASDAGHESLAAWEEQTGEPALALVKQEVRQLMAADAKATGLKALQGLIWDGGFRSGQLVAHTFPDVIPSIRKWRSAGFDVRIYSSGSIAAQKLFFGHVDGVGNCLDLFTGHYDTTIGGKKEPNSYARVATDWGLQPNEILFISDIAEELEAASKADVLVLASVRPGNHPLAETLDADRIESFEEVPLG